MVLETISESRALDLSLGINPKKSEALCSTAGRADDFIAEPDPARPTMSAAKLLDQAALSRAVGGGFIYRRRSWFSLLRKPSNSALNNAA